MAYIEKEPIIEFIEKGLNNQNKEEAFGYDAIKILAEIEYAPTADVAEVKHGYWIKHRDDGDCEYIECSVCGEEFYPPNNEFDFDKYPKHCQECGAKMDGERKEKCTT